MPPADLPPLQGHDPAEGHGHDHDHGPFLSRLLELDGEVHAEMLTAATARVAERVEPGSEVHRMLDIGSGVGTGTIALANRFPAAEIIAVDVSEDMLAQVRDRARDAGLGDRVTTRLADVAEPADDLGPADVAWASASLHEVSDAGSAFRHLFTALRPGGLLAVLEMDAAPRVLPAELADWEERVRAAGGGSPADHPDWTTQIAAAGFETPRTDQLVTDERPPAHGRAGEYAALELRRIGHAGMATLGEQDRSALRTLGGDGPGGIGDLDALWIRGTRTLWTARRP